MTQWNNFDSRAPWFILSGCYDDRCHLRLCCGYPSPLTSFARKYCLLYTAVSKKFRVFCQSRNTTLYNGLVICLSSRTGQIHWLPPNLKWLASNISMVDRNYDSLVKFCHTESVTSPACWLYFKPAETERLSTGCEQCQKNVHRLLKRRSFRCMEIHRIFWDRTQSSSLSCPKRL